LNLYRKEKNMKVSTNITNSISFNDITPGECFLYSGEVYLRFSEFIFLSANQDSAFVGGSTAEIGGYNAVRLKDGRPGSFKNTTLVVPKRLAVAPATT
jgi:hypothetical protein